MKKALLSVIGILTILIVFSFCSSNFSTQRIIKITSESQNEFDMVQNGVITKGIKTPYEFIFSERKGDFIFKSKNNDQELKINVNSKYGNLIVEWNTVVLNVENNDVKIYGMN
ncbi:hypothetical protein [Tenacibaculum sp. SG-28]|uniref:hypothetical protein n=1 Tax=Tenacibaculum sp. SG-28 TaxID=754426 RepID=UPI000CF4075B|nr:hypothetical protein [Tenacibaculum sp. SG-28]PQJ20615.1 hypothetical protein BSU00_09890 [Tenacibaculum sp. SG-28]